MARTLLPKQRIPIRHLLVFGWMPSFLKVWLYRHVLGYRIGHHVTIAFGGVVIGRDVELGDHVEVGMLAVVQGRQIRIGRHSSVGTMSYVSCEVIDIGEDARIREQVYVGGPQLPESRFTLGSRTIVLQMAYINPTKPVTIGDDTGIGGHCLIFTHGAWLNALDGYPVTYEPVTLGKSVWLPWRVFLMPGTTIGDGSVIGANSLVSGDIPANSLAVGSPAKVIKSGADFPRPLSAEARAAKVAEIIAEFDRYVVHNDVRVDGSSEMRTYSLGGETERLFWSRDGALPSDQLREGDAVLVERALTDDERVMLRARKVGWLDLGAKTRSKGGSPLLEELVVFVGRYGIRPVRDK